MELELAAELRKRAHSEPTQPNLHRWPPSEQSDPLELKDRARFRHLKPPPQWRVVHPPANGILPAEQPTGGVSGPPTHC
jgi:hypothetical protein